MFERKTNVSRIFSVYVIRAIFPPTPIIEIERISETLCFNSFPARLNSREHFARVVTVTMKVIVVLWQYLTAAVKRFTFKFSSQTGILIFSKTFFITFFRCVIPVVFYLQLNRGSFE